ncbi:hypothetical protein M427DRAFT_60032 [Gonapodya prolifera JEL478]|uniref:ERCC4 domain-containing protein n=1 Tax=Gonapodya prolifera (strain JEL478) TaxID=1344416 RepID=A0A139A5G3_GONPJ|nr:hypothetical protein M427DRAFT_60032 [Gonapodya prolifera JEL478]|eukprot:KXS11888.1 hypothetical protein M427DRAFT_60032 [Gonapodya prolifera JEL478]
MSVEDVLAICPHMADRRIHIIRDLSITNSVEETVNRILDGTFDSESNMNEAHGVRSPKSVLVLSGSGAEAGLRRRSNSPPMDLDGSLNDRVDPPFTRHGTSRRPSNPSPDPPPVRSPSCKHAPLKLLDLSDDEEPSKENSKPLHANGASRYRPKNSIRIPGNISSESEESSSESASAAPGGQFRKGGGDKDSFSDDALPVPKKKRTKRSQEDIEAAKRAKEEARRGREMEREEKRRKKEEEKEQKKMERELKQRKKLEEKAVQEEEKRIEKQQREANRLRSKSDGMAEMIVDVDLTIVNDATFGVSLLAELKKLGVLAVNAVQLPVPNTVRWTRRSTVKYDVETEKFNPVPEYEEVQSQIIVLLDAFEFAAAASSDHDLQNHINQVCRAFPDHQVTYVIVGLRDYYKKHKSLINVEYRNRVLGPDETVVAPKKGKNKGHDISKLPDQATVERQLLYMQMVLGCKVIECHDAELLIEWMHSFTQEVGIKPYAAWKENLFDFDHNSIRSGSGNADTWLKILMGMHRLTETHARAIAEVYPTMQQLMDAYSRCGANVAKASKLLAEIQVNNGTLTEPSWRKIGPALSSRMYSFFAACDPFEAL